MFARFFQFLIQALIRALGIPFQLLGWRHEPTADDIALEAVEAARADPIPAPAPAPREPTPMADLLLAHARARIYTHERHNPIPLPAALRLWFERLTDNEVLKIIGMNAVQLQRHVNAGLQGSTARGPEGLPPILPEEVLAQAKRGSTGGTRANPTLSEVLADLGYAPTPTYGPRR